MNLKNKKVWLLSALSFVLGTGLSAGVFYYKGQFNVSSFERQAQNEALSETDDYKIQTQMKVSERTPQSKIGTVVKLSKQYLRRGAIEGQDLNGAIIESTTLEDVLLRGKDCIEASFKHSHFVWAPRQARQHGYPPSSAPFDVSPLRKTNFTGSNFQGAVINATDLREVNFNSAKMQGIKFQTPEIRPEKGDPNVFKIVGYPGRSPYYWPEGIDIPENPFSWHIDRSTDFRGAWLHEADLSELKDLHLAQLEGAVYNSKTKFPEDFNPGKHGMLPAIEMKNVTIDIEAFPARRR